MALQMEGCLVGKTKATEAALFDGMTAGLFVLALLTCVLNFYSILGDDYLLKYLWQL